MKKRVWVAASDIDGSLLTMVHATKEAADEDIHGALRDNVWSDYFRDEPMPDDWREAYDLLCDTSWGGVVSVEDFTIDVGELEDARDFQNDVDPWLIACFGNEIARDAEERNHRFLEEALELVQACGCTAHEARQLVDYVFGRPSGDRDQEVGGVMVTLAALCLAQGLNMHEAGDRELARVWTKIDAIRAKQAAKPKHSPLPQ